MYIIAGCNGAGKTTAAYNLLPDTLNCREFVNADEIARGISPFQPEKATYEAGKILLQRIDGLIARGENFMVETTLSAMVSRDMILKAQDNGYHVNLFFFWLNSVALAKERVRLRVMEGGHSVSDTVIARRYQRGIQNLFNVFLPLCDNVMVFDNSDLHHRLIMTKLKGQPDEIHDTTTYHKILSSYVK